MRGLLLRTSLMALALAILVALAPGTVPAETPTKKARKGRPATAGQAEGTLAANSKLDALTLARHIDKVIERQLKRQSSKTSQQTASEPSDEDRSKNQPGRDR